MGQKPIRYAVVGQGYFSQSAILPSFGALSNSQLVGVFSDDPHKLEGLEAKYDVEFAAGYDDYDRLLASGAVDAVYIALPNSMHCEYTLRAARARIHVLCEKPMAATEDECEQMITACENAGVKLMIAYRLHFEEANLEAIELATSGELGDVRSFSSLFSMNVREGNTRLRRDLAGGPLNDIGIYCINAARYIFRSEPVEVTAIGGRAPGDARFSDVSEQYGAVLRFPEDRIATFLCSFNGADAGYYEVVGTKGTLRVDPAYSHSMALAHKLTIDGKTKEKTFGKRDQVAPEIMYFSNCIAQNRTPEPSGYEGLADVRVIQALESSSRSGRAMPIEPITRTQRPSAKQEIKVKAHAEAELIGVEPPQASKT